MVYYVSVQGPEFGPAGGTTEEGLGPPLKRQTEASYVASAEQDEQDHSKAHPVRCVTQVRPIAFLFLTMDGQTIDDTNHVVQIAGVTN